MTTEFFIEVNPGRELEAVIGMTKERVKAHLGDAVVDDPTKTKFLRDTPHFTMQVARTEDFMRMIEAYTNVARRFANIDYTIDGVGQAVKGGLVEVHATVTEADQRRFRDIHYALVEASRPFLAQEPPAMFPAANFTGYEAENLAYCHFPPGRGNYKPHASVGRFHENTLKDNDLQAILAQFKPEGNYTTNGLIVWQYVPNDPTFQVRSPLHIPLKK
jgi:hypothetical protein